jgi:hypothetical protein
LRGARPPCGGTAVRSSRPLRADRMIARRGHGPQVVLSTRFGRSGRVIHDPSTVAVPGRSAGPMVVPREGGRPVSRAGVRSRRSGRPRRPCGGRGEGSWDSRSCRSRGAGRRPDVASGAAHRRLARREREARRFVARGSSWTSCPVRAFPGRSAYSGGLGPCDGWSPGEYQGREDRVATRRGERGVGCSDPAQAPPELAQAWGRASSLSNGRCRSAQCQCSSFRTGGSPRRAAPVRRGRVSADLRLLCEHVTAVEDRRVARVRLLGARSVVDTFIRFASRAWQTPGPCSDIRVDMRRQPAIGAETARARPRTSVTRHNLLQEHSAAG